MPQFFDKIKEEIKDHPEATLGALVAGGTVAFFIVKERMAAANSASSSSSQQSTLAADQLNGYELASLAGLPYGYIDPTNGPGGPGPGPTPPPTPPTNSMPKLTIRPKTPVDPANSKRTGVPLFQAVGSFGHSVAEIPYGAQIQATGQPITGASNKGNTTWYPVTYNGKSGFVSGFDIANVGSGGEPTIGMHDIFTSQGLAPEMVGWQ